VENTNTLHQYKDYRNATSIIINPADKISFCDLRGVSLEKLNLSEVEFSGCRLGGASFKDTNLSQTKFIGCFATESDPPLNIQNYILKDTQFINCHLPTVSVQNATTWPENLVEAAQKLLYGDNLERNRAVETIGQINNPIVAPFLATSLIDEQWDVVLRVIRSLLEIRQNAFLHHDREIFGWIIFQIGHEAPLIREEISELIKKNRPDDDFIEPVLAQMKSSIPSQQLAGLLAAGELYHTDHNYLRLIDVAGLKSLFYSPEEAIRDECLHLLGIIDAPPPSRDWLIAGLSDPKPEVRIAALNGSKLLGDRLPSALILPLLLQDPDPMVRIEAAYALGQVDDWISQSLVPALEDKNLEVRRLAAALIEKGR
jgi:Pentapeptide repeats (8 copies)/HEAT repeat